MYYEEIEFTKDSFKEKDWSQQEFYKCKFIGVDFSNGNLQESDFDSCNFEKCNFSVTNVSNCKLNNVFFDKCTFRGINFSELSPFVQEFNFKECILEFTVFSGMKFSKMTFEGTEIIESNFSKCILKEINFKNCDFRRTMFSGCEFTKSDFRGSMNLGIDILNNKIKACKIGRFEAGEMLKQFGFVVE